MSDFFLDLLLAKSNKQIGEQELKLIKILFNSCYDLPTEAEKIRPSAVAFNNLYKWGGSVENALASSILTLNSQHGPFSECYDLIENYFEKGFDYLRDYVKMQDRVVGFGNPIVKTRDKRCIAIQAQINILNLKYSLLSEVVERLIKEKCGHDIFSNLAFWSAAGAHVLNLPKTHSSIIPIIAFSLRYLNNAE